MDSIESLQWRYATKKFDSEKNLETSQLELLAQAFNLTATSYGLQPCRLIVVQDQDLKEKMVPHSYGQMQVKDASAVLVICTTVVDEQYVKDYFSIVKKERNTPDEVIQPFQDFLTSTFSKKESEEIELWAKNQAYLILGNLLTVCAQQQIDSCPMEGFVPEKIDELLDLKAKGLKSTLLLPVGYRAIDDLMSQLKKVRRPQQEMVSFL
ncbi:NAD(P)H-dependent oxidoreductase [Nonlabens sp. Ci31]|jgi:nitroreductase|uniref:NAD(P)H-dependent oxidoreductase n=1 Tax=Nonlabens sp. Ci31 TaxID=2608253 RepID=UPI0014644BD1|nr:NAD(P)H-dependent oxidoreductase [Nonlabens sp. Ci31]QJP34699.1 NAD(P)H-dependent oxidoreductase [Nonlabens sp. Ci31]